MTGGAPTCWPSTTPPPASPWPRSRCRPRAGRSRRSSRWSSRSRPSWGPWPGPADALHTQTTHTQDLTARGAALLARLRALPWPDVPAGRTRHRGPGGQETRTLKAVTGATPTGLGFPHAAQAVRIIRTRRQAGQTTRETAYLIVTLPAEHPQPEQLNG